MSIFSYFQDGLYGEICMKNSTTAALQAFYNDGYSASFFSAVCILTSLAKCYDPVEGWKAAHKKHIRVVEATYC